MPKQPSAASEPGSRAASARNRRALLMSGIFLKMLCS